MYVYMLTAYHLTHSTISASASTNSFSASSLAGTPNKPLHPGQDRSGSWSITACAVAMSCLTVDHA